MVEPGPRPASSGTGSGGTGTGRIGADDGDWTVQAADKIERLVGAIRDKTSLPVTTLARALVFGLLAAIMGVVVAVLLSVMLVRVVDVVTGDGNVWIAHLVVGGIFSLAGGFLLRKATTTTAR